MVKGYSDEFKDGTCFEKFRIWIKEKFNIELSVDKSKDEKHLKIVLGGGVWKYKSIAA